jgi:RNA polymerase sigma-70 factor (ECF subfamily)
MTAKRLTNSDQPLPTRRAVLASAGVVAGTGLFVSRGFGQSAGGGEATRPARQSSRGGITGVADAPPVVVSTVPRAGDDQVDSSLTELKVTFSKDMTDGNWAWAQVSKETFPETTGRPHYEADRRTCVLPVKLQPGHAYVIWLNRPPFDSFTDTDGRKAVQYLLTFETRA